MFLILRVLSCFSLVGCGEGEGIKYRCIYKMLDNDYNHTNWKQRESFIHNYMHFLKRWEKLEKGNDREKERRRGGGQRWTDRQKMIEMRRGKIQTTMTILGISWRDHITNEIQWLRIHKGGLSINLELMFVDNPPLWIWAIKYIIEDQPPLATRSDKYKLQYFGHVSRILGKETTLKKIIIQGTFEGTRIKGRPKLRWSRRSSGYHWPPSQYTLPDCRRQMPMERSHHMGHNGSAMNYRVSQKKFTPRKLFCITIIDIFTCSFSLSLPPYLFLSLSLPLSLSLSSNFFPSFPFLLTST